MKNKREEQSISDKLVNEEVEKFVKELMEMPYDLSKLGQSFVTFLPRQNPGTQSTKSKTSSHDETE